MTWRKSADCHTTPTLYIQQIRLQFGMNRREGEGILPASENLGYGSKCIHGISSEARRESKLSGTQRNVLGALRNLAEPLDTVDAVITGLP